MKSRDVPIRRVNTTFTEKFPRIEGCPSHGHQRRDYRKLLKFETKARPEQEEPDELVAIFAENGRAVSPILPLRSPIALSCSAARLTSPSLIPPSLHPDTQTGAMSSEFLQLGFFFTQRETARERTLECVRVQ
jgi:hypothetical protein